MNFKGRFVDRSGHGAGQRAGQRAAQRAGQRAGQRAAALVVAILASVGASAASAQTLRWATQGDAQTMDPHSQNESLTNQMGQQVYEGLVDRDKAMKLVPRLAVSWQQTGPTAWRMKLRPDVKFQDGSPFTADDVVFSVGRAKDSASALQTYAMALGEPVKVDDMTVDFKLAQVNPIFLEHLATIPIMSRIWCEKNNAIKPLNFKGNEEKYTSLHANGTGPFILVSRQPDVKTTYKRNPAWWGKFEGNLQEVVYTPIKSDATRSAALISGEIDFVLDPAPQDVNRLRSSPGVKVIDGPENRIIFVGMDQGRDELLYSNVKGRNPFKDVRVRKALYEAVDIATIKSRLMRDQAFPTGAVMPSPLGDFSDAALEARLPYNLDDAKKLMAEAGYPQGFEVSLDCPNNRYVNDEEICQALAAMWKRVNVTVRVNAMPRVQFFPKLEKLDTSMYLLGWGGSITDAETTLTPIYHSRTPAGLGSWNYAQIKNAKLDGLVEASSREPDVARRETLIKGAVAEFNAQVHAIPLHRQFVPWAARDNVTVVHRPDNWLEWSWITVK